MRPPRNTAGRGRRRALLALLAAALPLAGMLGAAPPPLEGPEAAAQFVDFNFDRVDLRLLVKLVGEMTARQFVVADDVSQKVTVITPARIPRAEVYPLFLSILEASGFTVTQSGAVHYIVPLPPRDVPGAPVVTNLADAAGGLVTKVIKLDYINAGEAKKALDPMVGGGKTGALVAFPASNHLIVTDTIESLRRLEGVIRQLDQPGATRMVEVVALTYASAEDVARQVMAAMAGAENIGAKLSRHVREVAEGITALPLDAFVVPAPQANSLVLVGTPVQINELKEMVRMLDTEGMAGRGPLNAIFLKYLSAEQGAKSLTALLDKNTDENTRGRIAIEANTMNNALIVNASPRDFDWVKQLVDRLDQPPEQVLVEVLIAEVTLGKRLDLGVEWSTVQLPQDDQYTVVGRSRPGNEDTIMESLAKGVFPQGLTLGVAKGTYMDVNGNVIPLMPVLLRALAENENVKILSNVPLWAQNNVQASVSVVENIPLLKSTVDQGAGTTIAVTKNIERKDVGISLKVTPHVTPDRQVTLELNPVIEAIIDAGPKDEYTPTFAKREVNTTVTVADRATIAITGLIREDHLETVSKVPLLGDIPWLGALFRRTDRQLKRTNLLVFVTPTVVTDPAAAEEIKQAWEQRTQVASLATNVTVRTQFSVPATNATEQASPGKR